MWLSSNEYDPIRFNVECGDRILVIIKERKNKRCSIQPKIIILTATENSYESDDSTYNCYTPEDGVLWCLEKDICRYALAYE